MAIGNCDACDRQNVPGASGEACGIEGFFCFICRGDIDDPYCEREQPCFACGGECGFDDGGRCEACKGTGAEWAEPQPMTADDLDEMSGTIQ